MHENDQKLLQCHPTLSKAIQSRPGSSEAVRNLHNHNFQFKICFDEWIYSKAAQNHPRPSNATDINEKPSKTHSMPSNTVKHQSELFGVIRSHPKPAKPQFSVQNIFWWMNLVKSLPNRPLPSRAVDIHEKCSKNHSMQINAAKSRSELSRVTRSHPKPSKAIKAVQFQ